MAEKKNVNILDPLTQVQAPQKIEYNTPDKPATASFDRSGYDLTARYNNERSNRGTSMSRASQNIINEAKQGYNNAQTPEEQQYWHNRAEAERNKYGFSGGASGNDYVQLYSGYKPNEVEPRGGQALAKLYGIDVDEDSIYNKFKNQYDEAYKVKDAEMLGNEVNYARDIASMGKSYKDALYQATNEAAMTGASRGSREASMLAQTLGLQTESMKGTTQLAADRQKLADSRAKDYADMAVDVENLVNTRRQALGTLDAALMAPDVQDAATLRDYFATQDQRISTQQSNDLQTLLENVTNKFGYEVDRANQKDQTAGEMYTTDANRMNEMDNTYANEFGSWADYISRVYGNQTDYNAKIYDTDKSAEAQIGAAQINANAQTNAARINAASYKNNKNSDENANPYAEFEQAMGEKNKLFGKLQNGTITNDEVYKLGFTLKKLNIAPPDPEKTWEDTLFDWRGDQPR